MLRLSRKGRTDPPRDLLNHLVLKVWTDKLKEPLTTGRPNSAATGKRREANSPGVRFLIAALKPLIEIGPEAAEVIIEKQRDTLPNRKIAFAKLVAKLTR